MLAVSLLLAVNAFEIATGKRNQIGHVPMKGEFIRNVNENSIQRLNPPTLHSIKLQHFCESHAENSTRWARICAAWQTLHHLDYV